MIVYTACVDRQYISIDVMLGGHILVPSLLLYTKHLHDLLFGITRKHAIPKISCHSYTQLLEFMLCRFTWRSSVPNYTSSYPENALLSYARGESEHQYKRYRTFCVQFLWFELFRNIYTGHFFKVKGPSVSSSEITWVIPCCSMRSAMAQLARLRIVIYIHKLGTLKTVKFCKEFAVQERDILY